MTNIRYVLPILLICNVLSLSLLSFRDQFTNKPHWCIYYLIKSMNKSHKVGRAHGWILYCGLIMPLLVAFLVDFVILEVIWVNMICGRLDFVCARLWSFVPSSFPWALKILLYIIKSWNFQDLIRLCSSESSECFLHCLIKHTIYFSKEMIHDQTSKIHFGSTSISGPHPSRASYV